MTAQPHHVLFVDDDPAFLESVGGLFLAWSGGTWTVHTAATTAQALQLLRERPLDLAVVDLQMPVMDGVQFLGLLSRSYPTLRKIILTGFATDTSRAAALDQGAELFLEKPRSQDGYETLFATLNELASLPHQEGFRGVLRQVGLPDLIQMECLGRKSSVLEVANGQVRGLIYVDQGAIVHAQLGTIRGEPAFNNLLCLRGGEFNLKPFTPPPERSISAQWEFLLMEAVRMRDELAELSATAAPLPPAEPGPLVADAAAAKPPPDAMAPPAADLTPPAAAPAESTQIDELVLCSGQSEVLYEWQCRDVEGRLKLLDALGQWAEQLAGALSLGRFDRMEALGPQGRVVTQIGSGQKVLLRCSRAPASAPSSHAEP